MADLFHSYHMAVKQKVKLKKQLRKASDHENLKTTEHQTLTLKKVIN